MITQSAAVKWPVTGAGEGRPSVTHAVIGRLVFLSIKYYSNFTIMPREMILMYKLEKIQTVLGASCSFT